MSSRNRLTSQINIKNKQVHLVCTENIFVLLISDLYFHFISDFTFLSLLFLYIFWFQTLRVCSIPWTHITISRVEKHTPFFQILLFLTPFNVLAFITHLRIHLLLEKTTLFKCFLVRASYPPLNTCAPSHNCGNSTTTEQPFSFRLAIRLANH